MDMAEIAQSGALGLAPAAWGIIAGLLAGAVVVMITLMRVGARLNDVTAENHYLRHAMHEMREYSDVVSGRLEHNLLVQRDHLGQIADFLEFQQPLEFDVLRRADPALPDTFLPDVDLQESDDYAGEPLIHSDPSRVVAMARPEPGLLARIRPLGGIGDVADESGAEADRVANESFAHPAAQAGRR